MLALLGQNEERKAAKLDKKRDALLKKAEKLKGAYEDDKKRLEQHHQEDACIAAEARKCERQLVELLRKASVELEQSGLRVQQEKDKVAETVDTRTASLARLVVGHNAALDAAVKEMWAGEAAGVKEERAGEEGGLAA
ncbi:hypothetical protein JCM9279_001048 [Rhodotorula babjevae]